MAERRPTALLEIRGLNVFYGRSHALQGVDLKLEHGVLSLVGRNGMGKTTLCKAILGLIPIASGSIRFMGEELVGRTPAEIARLGLGYVPQGRRLWPSLTVDEHLQLAAGSNRSRWTIPRIYEAFPRIAERRNSRGNQLSGGEQQMLAIARILRTGAHTLLLDEPTEGLAPVIVQQIGRTIRELKNEGFNIILVEQNFLFASTVADRHYVVEQGRVIDMIPNAELKANMEKLHTYLGV
jgi:branched-chain amino acid transport system ATP-binding protein